MEREGPSPPERAKRARWPLETGALVGVSEDRNLPQQHVSGFLHERD
jgi:hypothetical protein